MAPEITVSTTNVGGDDQEETDEWEPRLGTGAAVEGALDVDSEKSLDPGAPEVLVGPGESDQLPSDDLQGQMMGPGTKESTSVLGQGNVSGDKSRQQGNPISSDVEVPSVECRRSKRRVRPPTSYSI